MVPKKSQFSPNFCLCGFFLRKVPNSKACIRTPVCDFGLVLPGGAPVNKNPVCTFVANMLHLITKNAGIFLIKTKPVSKSGNTEGALTMMGEKKLFIPQDVGKAVFCLDLSQDLGVDCWSLKHSECLGIRGDTLPVELAIDRL